MLHFYDFTQCSACTILRCHALLNDVIRILNLGIRFQPSIVKFSYSYERFYIRQTDNFYPSG